MRRPLDFDKDIYKCAINCVHDKATPMTGKNKTNYPISSNSHPSATANRVIHCLKRGGGDTKPTGTSYNLDKV